MTKEEKRNNSLYELAYLYVRDKDKVISRTLSESTYQHILLNHKAGDNSIFRRLTKTPTETNQKKMDVLLESLRKDSLEYRDSRIKTFEDLEKALPENRVEQIKKSNRNLPVLIIGGNRELVNGIVNYFWFAHPVINLKSDDNSPEYISSLIEGTLKGYTGRIHFEEVDYTGRPESYIHEDIESKLEHYFNGGMLFLRGIEGKFIGVFKFLASKAYNRTEMKGVLIINTNGTNNLPQDLKDQFEKIELEAEKQDTAKQAKFIPFPTPHGTQWHEVKISFIDNENVKISARGVTEKRHYSEMEFKNDKSNKPIFLWKFLKELASLSGRFTNCSNKEKDKVKKYFSGLRKALFQLFNINGDPIPYKKTKDYTGYETVFIIENKSHDREYEESVRGHHREYISPKKYTIVVETKTRMITTTSVLHTTKTTEKPLSVKIHR